MPGKRVGPPRLPAKRENAPLDAKITRAGSRIVELRCPVGPRRLLAKTVVPGEHPKIVEGNLVELACDDCKRTMRQQGKPVLRVLHRYNLLGELVESEAID